MLKWKWKVPRKSAKVKVAFFFFSFCISLNPINDSVTCKNDCSEWFSHVFPCLCPSLLIIHSNIHHFHFIFMNKHCISQLCTDWGTNSFFLSVDPQVSHANNHLSVILCLFSRATQRYFAQQKRLHVCWQTIRSNVPSCWSKTRTCRDLVEGNSANSW